MPVPDYKKLARTFLSEASNDDGWIDINWAWLEPKLVALLMQVREDAIYDTLVHTKERG